jgi:hypothetical protein
LAGSALTVILAASAAQRHPRFQNPYYSSPTADIFAGQYEVFVRVSAMPIIEGF